MRERGTPLRRGGFRQLLLGALLIVGACGPKPRAAQFTLSEEEWDFAPRTGRILTTDHFRIYTSIDDVELRTVLPLFAETAYLQYSALIYAGKKGPPPSAAGSDRKLTTYLLRNREEWERFSRRFFPQRYATYARISYGGYTEQDTAVVYYDRQRSYTLSVLAHEGLHQYLYNLAGPAIPAWLNEGLACYCEAFDVPGNDVPVFTPTHNTFRLNYLREALAGKTMIPLKDILATDAGRVIDQYQAKPYYAQVWSLLVYLRHGGNGRYAKGLERLLADLVGGQMATRASAARLGAPHPAEVSAGEAVFRAYITDDLEAFDRGWQAYVMKLVSF
jgi:hypothetical protein